MIINSDIPVILSKHNINLDKVLDKSKFPLLDNSLPDISFDRLDYFMRDGYVIRFLPKMLIKEFLNNIFEEDDTFYFKDHRLASTFTILFISFSRLIWLDPTAHGAFHLLANAIKLALKNNVITEDDFFTDDEEVLKKLKASNNTDIHNLLNRLKPGSEFIYSTKEDADFSGSNKPRSVNPYVLQGTKLIRIADIVPSLDYFFDEFKETYSYISVKQKIK
jgi:HD superfamily phosphohydrolase